MEPWGQWLEDWRRMAATAKRHGWQVSGPKLAAPASAHQIAAFERKHGVTVPPQLRMVLTEFAQRVDFSWRIPRHLQAHGRFAGKWCGGMRDVVWDFDQLASAINNFASWRADLGSPHAHTGEEPNSPEMWENQFAFAEAMNGDMLTIDVTHPDGAQQPVRYFSHELEGLHAHALAENFNAFMTVYSKLGCVGNTHDDWFSFVAESANKANRWSLLSEDAPGAREWLAWLDADHKKKSDDEAPTPVPAKTTADRDLLKAAAANDMTGVQRALREGADPDCYDEEDDGFREFTTAISDAASHGNPAMIDLLLAHGATLDTRRLPMAAAVHFGATATVAHLIARGARVNGWAGDRYSPLHILFEQRPQFNEMYARGQIDEIGRIILTTDFSRFGSLDPDDPDFMAKTQAMLEDAFRPGADNRSEAQITRQRQDSLAILDMLLDAGADANAPWDNGLTMLMRAGTTEAMTRLLAHGGDPNRRDYHGWTALHHARTPDIVQLLLAHGAEINALSVADPRDSNPQPARTPLQVQLSSSRHPGNAQALLDAGADPHVRDDAGRSALFYCRTSDMVQALIDRGLDVGARGPDGGTILHFLVQQYASAIADDATKDLISFLIYAGVDIDAQDADGATALHRLAQWSDQYRDLVAEAQILLDLGARADIRDRNGKRPVDLVHKNAKDLRALLK